MLRLYGKKEIRLGVRSISLPLDVEDIFENSDLIEFKKGKMRYKNLSKEEVKWVNFLAQELVAYNDWCIDLGNKFDEKRKKLEKNSELSQKLTQGLSFLREQANYGAFFLERCHFVLEAQKQNGPLQAQEMQKMQASLTTIKAENEALRARVAELENVLQKATEGEKKGIDPRERKTFLKLIHAALSLERRFSPSNSSLAGLLAAKTQELYPAKPVDNDTIKKKLNEIIALHKDFSE